MKMEREGRRKSQFFKSSFLYETDSEYEETKHINYYTFRKDEKRIF